MKIRFLWLTKHFTRPRRRKIAFVIWHHMTIVGNLRGRANDDCKRVWGSRPASAHYGVDGDDVAQFVRDEDAAWSTGNSVGNHAGLSIENANSSRGPKWLVDQRTWMNAAMLTALLHVKHGLGRPTSNPSGRTGTLRQHRWWTSTACPGPYLVSIWHVIVAQAQKFYDELEHGKRHDRLGKIIMVNHAAATVALKRPGAWAKWLLRRVRVVSIAKDKKPSILVGLECGGGSAWHYISTKYKKFGLVLVIAAGGRAIWRDAATTEAPKASDVFKPAAWKGDVKEVPWYLGKVNGKLMLVLGAHLDSDATVAHNVKVANQIVEFAFATAKAHGIGRSSIYIMIDTADKSGKVFKTFVDRGFASAFDVAEKTVGKNLASMTYFKPAVNGYSVDHALVWAGDGKTETGPDAPRGVEVASKTATKNYRDLDHLVLGFIPVSMY